MNSLHFRLHRSHQSSSITHSSQCQFRQCPTSSHRRNHAQSHTTRSTKNQSHPTDSYLTPPIYSEKTESLSGPENALQPLWGTFCGSIEGLWVGTACSINPMTGNIEPISRSDDGKTKIFEIYQCCVEERLIVDDIDSVVRHTARAASPEELAHEMVAAGNLKFEPTSSIDWDVDRLTYLEEGLFIFDGGTYSKGPTDLLLSSNETLEEEDDESTAKEEEELLDDGICREEPTLEEEFTNAVDTLTKNNKGIDLDTNTTTLKKNTNTKDARSATGLHSSLDSFHTSMLEFSLQWNGEERIQIQVVLSCSLVISEINTPTMNTGQKKKIKNVLQEEEELDVNILRVSICRECWEGVPQIYTSKMQSETERKSHKLSAGSRINADDVTGFWNEFQVSATTVEDIDLQTGLMAKLPVYSSMEVQKFVRSQDQTIRKKMAPMTMPNTKGPALKSNTNNTNNMNEKQNFNSPHLEQEGGILWLPHRAALQLTMVPPSPHNNGKGCLDVTALWAPQDGLVLGVTRRYTALGQLEEVISTTSIRAE